MTTKHTPGPWHIGQGNGEGRVFADTDGLRMRMTPRGTALFPIATFAMGWNAEEDAANGRLIAAAPDLLEALTQMLWCIEDGAGDSKWDAACDQSRAAIAKAKGE